VNFELQTVVLHCRRDALEITLEITRGHEMSERYMVFHARDALIHYNETGFQNKVHLLLRFLFQVLFDFLSTFSSL